MSIEEIMTPQTIIFTEAFAISNTTENMSSYYFLGKTMKSQNNLEDKLLQTIRKYS